MSKKFLISLNVVILAGLVYFAWLSMKFEQLSDLNMETADMYMKLFLSKK